MVSTTQEFLSQMSALRSKVVMAYLKKKKLAKKIVPFERHDAGDEEEEGDAE